MIDRLTAMSWLEGLAQDDWRECHSDSEVQEIARQTLAMLKEQKEQMKHLNNIILEYEKEVFRLQTMLKEQEAQRDYEANVEMTEYCERYEQTYNPEDGSM